MRRRSLKRGDEVFRMGNVDCEDEGLAVLGLMLEELLDDNVVSLGIVELRQGRLLEIIANAVLPKLVPLVRLDDVMDRRREVVLLDKLPERAFDDPGISRASVGRDVPALR